MATLSPERWQQVSPYLDQVLALPEAERTAWLESFRAERPDLSDLLQELLEEHRALSNQRFLEGSPTSRTSETSMALAPGTRLGPYEIGALLGAGGMGEVYRARDTRLGRDVALKFLPALFMADADRVARFEREARLLASLNHPHIGAIYGLEDTSNGRALVLELVGGTTLADRVRRGKLPLSETLVVAQQISDALEAAHKVGIIHRDLKPSNIKVTPDGMVKVLDFGLAKALAADGASPDRSGSAAATADGTRTGVILGTTAYMSPEQARAQPVDKRT